MHEIKIYGDIVHVSDKTDKNVSLADVQNQLKEANGQPIKVRIGSDGGDVDEGFAIYNELRRYAKDNKVLISTFAESRLASIATVIFLAGDKRELSQDMQPFVHMAYFNDGKELSEKEEGYLAAVNSRIAKHYALHTDLTEEEALELMNQETFINTEEAKAMRFATSIEQVLRPVALQRFTNANKNKMNKKTQTLLNKVAKFLGTFSNKKVTTADGKELDFYELEDDAVIAVGDKAYFDGMDADGSFIMPDGETYVLVAGELTEIQSEDETDTDSEALAEANATIALLTEQLEAVSNKAVELDAQNKSNLAIIAGYKASSKPAPAKAKEAPKAKEPEAKVSKASMAIANLNKNK